MTLIDRIPVGILEIGYSTTLPVTKVREREYYAKLPNGKNLDPNKLPDFKLKCRIDVDYEAPIDAQKYLNELGGKSWIHFWLRMYETRDETRDIFDKARAPFGDRSFYKKEELEKFNIKIEKVKQELLRIIKEIGLSPQDSEIYMLLSADERD